MEGISAEWRKSSYSTNNGGSCVEVAGTARVVLVRDTTDRDGQTLAFTAEAWRAFAEELHRACPGLRSSACSRFQAGRITSPPSSGYMATRLYLPLGDPEDLGRP